MSSAVKWNSFCAVADETVKTAPKMTLRNSGREIIVVPENPVLAWFPDLPK
jgi:hypothetical protein